MYLTDQACLLRKADSGERHQLLVFFMRENGLRTALARHPQRPGKGPALPDLFEFGRVTLQQRDASRPAFVHEYEHMQAFPEIARSYPCLRTAARLSRFFERNLIHMENFEEAWALLHAALTAMAASAPAQASLIKAVYRMARSEGYPVFSNWLKRLPGPECRSVEDVLRQPVAAIDPARAEEIEAWLGSLFRFLENETDLLPPDT